MLERGPEGRLHVPALRDGCWRGRPSNCCLACWLRLATYPAHRRIRSTEDAPTSGDVATDGGKELDRDVDALVDEIRETWSLDDPKVLAADTEKNLVVADVDGELKAYHSGLVYPVETDVDALDAFLDSIDGDVDVRVERLSDHEARFTREQFEYER